MPAPNPQCYHLSASSIQAFKACPQRFRLAYREGIRLDRDTDSQRVGTHWHAMHEAYANAGGSLEAVLEILNRAYANVPAWIDADAWALERQILLTSFIGYLWYWQNDPVEFLASEVPFNLPLHEPRTGMPLPLTSVQRVGKIDHVVRWQDAVCALERKSTSRSIAPDSDYWDKSKKDTQVSMYALAFKDLFRDDGGGGGVIGVGTLRPGQRFGNTLYDVWHKPTIKPAMLTQTQTKAFIETGEYAGQKFAVLPLATEARMDGPDGHHVPVNGVPARVEMGKKGFALRETVEMFGARLLQDIYERPDFYYARREIVRTDAEIRGFRSELFAIYQAQQAFSRGNYWFSNESQCRATFPCSYIPICYGPGADAVCDGKATPAGFKRLFVDLTVNGKEVEE